MNRVKPKRLPRLPLPFVILLVITGCTIIFPPQKPERTEGKPIVLQTEKGPSVWDSRDPEVVYAEGAVGGWETRTFNFMVAVSESARKWFEAKKDEEGVRILVKYMQELALFIHELDEVKKNPGFGKTITFSSQEMQKLHAQLHKVTALMFPVLSRVSETGGTVAISRDETVVWRPAKVQ